MKQLKTKISHCQKELKEKTHQLMSKREEAVAVENELNVRRNDVENVKKALESLSYEEGLMEVLQKVFMPFPQWLFTSTQTLYEYQASVSVAWSVLVALLKDITDATMCSIFLVIVLQTGQILIEIQFEFPSHLVRFCKAYEFYNLITRLQIIHLQNEWDWGYDQSDLIQIRYDNQ